MFIINKAPMRVDEALANEKHPLHSQAKEYVQGLKYLRETYKDGKLTINRTGYPRFVKGIDSKGRDVEAMREPTPPAKFPLSTYFTAPKRGKELWACCVGEPVIKEGGLWELGDKKSFTVEDRIIVDINEDPDFAFYLYYISRAVKGGHLKVADPKADIKAKGDLKRQALERETAIWQTLADENQLRKIAQGWNVANVDTKEPDAIRFELESTLKTNDELRKKDPSIKGTKEFLEEMKITDYVRLSAFIRHWLDEGMITYKPDGRYRVGDKIIAQVPQTEVLKKFAWLCNYYAAPNNSDKAKELLHDLVNREYLDSVTDDKDFRWLAKVANIEGYFNKKADEVKKMVYTEFNLV